jgi:hypothetical protein
MVNKNFGQFESLEDKNPTGKLMPDELPAIAGSPLPDAGLKNRTMGDVFPEKDQPTPAQFDNRSEGLKRLKAMPNRSPLGPVTGARRPLPTQKPLPMQQDQDEVGTGDRWLGELWQGLTADEKPQGGFAGGGRVAMGSQPGMDLYNKVTMDLESGGVGGYAQGGMIEKSRDIASKGRNGDTMLMHVNPKELSGLQALLGPVTINPETGNPEAFAWFAALPLLGQMAVAGAAGAGVGAGVGAIAGGKEGALQGLAIGGMLGTLGAGAAGIAGAGAGAGSGLAPGAGVLAPGYGGGVTASQLAAGNVTAAELANLTAAGSGSGAGAGVGAGLKAASTGLSSLMSGMSRPSQSPASPPPMQPAPKFTKPVSPYDLDERRMAGGIGSIPGSGRIV